MAVTHESILLQYGQNIYIYEKKKNAFLFWMRKKTWNDTPSYCIKTYRTKNIEINYFYYTKWTSSYNGN